MPVADLDPSRLRQRFASELRVRPSAYWLDLLASALLGWSAFATAGLAGSPALRLCATGVAVLALYRAVLFIHEIAHLRRDALPGFELAWHALCGLPLMVPSLMYADTHGDHHRARLFGTEADPEYAPIARWQPARIVVASLVMLVLPAGLLARWGLLGPVSALVPPLRRWVVRSASTLVINASYQRREPSGAAARRFVVQEVAAACAVWAGALGLATGAIGPHWLGLWYAVGASILVLNHLRTLGAHRYHNGGEPLDRLGQLLDSVNLDGGSFANALLAPVGLRFHALHHLLPSLPYHSLGRVHRQLLAELPDASPYRRVGTPGLAAAVRDLFARASRAGTAFVR